MSLNSSSGSASHPMTHRAKQQSKNDERRKTNALKGKTEIVEPSIKSEEKIVDLEEILQPLPLSENLMKGSHDGVFRILDGYKNDNNETYIHEIISKLDENFIKRVKRGTYFEIGGVFYEVTEMPVFDGGLVDARIVFSENFENSSTRHSFTMEEVVRSMIPVSAVFNRMVQLLKDYRPHKKGVFENGEYGYPEKIYLFDDSRKPQESPISSPKIINSLDEFRKRQEFPYIAKDGNSHASMDDVRRANEYRYADLEDARLADERRRKILQPQYIKNDLITKIPKPQEFKYMDKDGKMHASMDDVRRANEYRYADLEDARLADERRRKILQPQYIKNDLITKIPKPYFNKDKPDA